MDPTCRYWDSIGLGGTQVSVFFFQVIQVILLKSKIRSTNLPDEPYLGTSPDLTVSAPPLQPVTSHAKSSQSCIRKYNNLLVLRNRP